MHQTVLLKETIDSLGLKPGMKIVDGTLGAGGHTEEICERFGPGIKVIGLDLDTDALERSKNRLGEKNCDIAYYQENFRNLDKVLLSSGFEKVDGIILDLGFSSDQLELSGRGFSFKKDEPLKMTLKKDLDSTEFDASDIVNTWDEEDIANVLYGYGEERFARRIAREIIEAREVEPIKTTGQLVEIVMSAVPAFYKFSRIHPATKTFQALRIATNSELESLREVLVKGFEALNPSGSFAIITFHSLEDRIVKNFFKTKVVEGQAKLKTKKPIIPSEEELKVNPRARSAKLRVIEKI